MRPLVVVLLLAAAACGPSTAPAPSTDAGSGSTGGEGDGGGSADAGSPRAYRVTVLLDGSGAVRSDPAGLDCGSICSATFAEGASVTLSAAPAAGYEFTGFSGACTGATCVLRPTADAQVVATFRPRAPSTVTLSLQLPGTGVGRVVSTPAGLDCTAACTGTFPTGAAVSLAATPGALSLFDAFGGACSGATCSLTLTADATVSASFRQQRYHLTDLGTPDNAQYSYSTSAAISPNGAYLSGIWQDGQNGSGQRGFLWSGTFRDLGTNQIESASGVDDSGTVVGSFFVPGAGAHAYRWRAGTLTDLGTLGGTYSAATRLNRSGVVVGVSSRADGQTHAVYWNASGITDLGSLGTGATTCSRADGINAAGVIVGSSCIATPAGSSRVPTSPGPPPPAHAVRFRGPSVIDDLGTLGGPYSEASAINDQGVIVGHSSLADGSDHGFVYGISMVDVGGLGAGHYSQLLDINNAGVAVGLAPDSHSQSHAVIYAGGRLIDLNDLSDGTTMTLDEALAIDDAGDIAAVASGNGTVRAVLLKPY